MDVLLLLQRKIYLVDLDNHARQLKIRQLKIYLFDLDNYAT